MKSSRRSWFVAPLAAALLALPPLAGTAFAQSGAYPSRTVRIVVPFAPGGATDQAARLIAAKMSSNMGVSVIVENQPGANGNIGAAYVAKAAPDGYVVLHNTSSIAFTAAFEQKVSYNLARDLVPVSLVLNQPLILVGGPALRARTLAGFIDEARANPGKVTYASSGTGNISHLAMLVMLKAANATAVHVPYKGGAAAFPDVIGGQVAVLADPVNSAYPFVRDGRVVALAVTGLKRSKLLPDVPTVAEALVPGFEVGAWQAAMLPAGTPPAIVQRVSAEYARAIQSADVRSRLEAQGADPIGSTPDEYRAYLNNEIKRWTEVIRSAQIKID